MIGKAPRMLRLYELIKKVSQITSPVLLTGETGTGKELVARSIHYQGSRRDKMLIPIDCSALSPTLIESELFGHVKGAFTGADRAKRGLLQVANRGTILLDEICELPVFMQAKLLRVLQEKEVRPIGSTELFPIDVRIIAATNRDLDAAVTRGTFRQDLYFRLNVVQIKLPALRERKVDIPLLVTYFLHKFSGPLQRVQTISRDALARLMAYDWPGNVRELENVIECAVTFCSGSTLSIDDVVFASDAPPDQNELVPMAEVERRTILHAVRQTQGNKLTAARLLGIGKTTLYRKLKVYYATP